MNVYRIDPKEAIPWILNKHYAKRKPPISYAFGLYDGVDIIGVITYGIPCSNHLCFGLCGKEYSNIVLELNRLCIDSEIKNAASFLISKSLNLLPRPMICVSYADTAMNHIGYVYQATNWIYTGETGEKKDRVVRSGNVHSRHNKPSDIDGEWRHETRSNKHRYVYFLGSKKQVKELKAALRYQIKPYPKGETKRYDDSGSVQKQTLLFA